MSVSQRKLKRERAIVRGWAEAGRLLDARRRAALAAQTPEEARQAAFDMLELGGTLPEGRPRQAESGLVEMQRLFMEFRDRGRGE